MLRGDLFGLKLREVMKNLVFVMCMCFVIFVNVKNCGDVCKYSLIWYINGW